MAELKPTNYIRDLDGLRTISVFLVLLSHWIEDCSLSLGFNPGELGKFGVNLFFTISGFLITRQLFIRKEKFNNPKRLLKDFFARRFLRLFPAYYTLLFLLIGLQLALNFWVVDDYKDYIWMFTYLSNLFFFENGNVYPSLNHTWSLAVEEQFYLFWPFVVLLFKKKHFLVLLPILVIAGLVIRSIEPDLTIFPIGSLNYLAAGALINFAHKIPRLTLIGGGVLITVVMLLVGGDVFHTVMTFAAFLIVLQGVESYPKWLNWYFGNRLVIYLGQISYGIYLYHRFIPYLILALLAKFQIDVPNSIIFILLFPIVYIIAHTSYKYLETPFLKLKSKIK